MTALPNLQLVLPPEAPATPQEPVGKARNVLWDSVALLWFCGTEANGFDVARPSRARCGKVVRDLKSLGATPKELAARVIRYRRQWPSAECTPESMVKHWERFADREKSDLSDRAAELFRVSRGENP